MRKSLLKELRPKKNAPLSKINTFGVGGKSKYLIEVGNADDLLFVWSVLNKEKIKKYLVSGGSNVLFSDRGFSGVIVHYKQDGHKGKDLTVDKKNKKIFSEANTSLARLINFSIKNNFSGLETLSGIPGTVGGAIVGNAGAYGHSISEAVSRVLIFDGKTICWIKNRECKFAYRESVFKKRKWVLLGVELTFKKRVKSERLKKISREIIKKRSGKYKGELKCPGSYFKNVLVCDLSKKSLALIDKKKIIKGKVPAGYLLEEIGAFNEKSGKITVSSFHGNLILNKGGGKYSDVKKLTNLLKRRVKNKFGITLEEEVQIVI